MQKIVKFINRTITRDSFTDNLRAKFILSIIDAALIGTPKDIPSRHAIELVISEYLMDHWRLTGAIDPTVISEDMEKVAFQLIEDHVTQLLQQGIEMEKVLPNLFLDTENSSKTCPYKISNIAYPQKSTFAVEIKEEKASNIHDSSTQYVMNSKKWQREGELIDYHSTSGSIIKVPDGSFFQAKELDLHPPDLQKTHNRVLIVTVTNVETRAVLNAANNYKTIYGKNSTYYDLGIVGNTHVFLVRSGMGSVGSSGSTVTISEAISFLQPNTIVATGIAFGVNPIKQVIGEILVSDRVFVYGPKRVGITSKNKSQQIPRGPRVSASPRLLDRFKDGEIHWSESSVRFGLIFSGEELIDNIARRNELLEIEPEAIGGEMEATGLYSIAEREKIDWIVVKAICDWADGKKGENKKANQELAAQNAAEFVFSVIRRGGLASQQSFPVSAFASSQKSSTDWIDISEQITNPGFEDGFSGWVEHHTVINSENADSSSVDDTSVAKSGIHSRKLFLRKGGSYIQQTITFDRPLPVHSKLRLNVNVRMPHHGTDANKWLTLMLITRGEASDQVEYAQIEQQNPLSEWTQLSVETESLAYPIHEVEIHALTTKGGGAHDGFDKPVWVDDFSLEYQISQ